MNFPPTMDGNRTIGPVPKDRVSPNGNFNISLADYKINA